mmetsp:Transcript_11513/g.41023  ORF Transcript_11513/g.41023 Transcript_11513/m.41023 type:complete len:298 (-) Transcript_11513:390-1283(-)
MVCRLIRLERRAYHDLHGGILLRCGQLHDVHCNLHLASADQHQVSCGLFFLQILLDQLFDSRRLMRKRRTVVQSELLESVPLVAQEAILRVEGTNRRGGFDPCRQSTKVTANSIEDAFVKTFLSGVPLLADGLRECIEITQAMEVLDLLFVIIIFVSFCEHLQQALWKFTKPSSTNDRFKSLLQVPLGRRRPKQSDPSVHLCGIQGEVRETYHRFVRAVLGIARLEQRVQHLERIVGAGLRQADLVEVHDDADALGVAHPVVACALEDLQNALAGRHRAALVGDHVDLRLRPPEWRS